MDLQRHPFSPPLSSPHQPSSMDDEVAALHVDAGEFKTWYSGWHKPRHVRPPRWLREKRRRRQERTKSKAPPRARPLYWRATHCFAGGVRWLPLPLRRGHVNEAEQHLRVLPNQPERCSPSYTNAGPTSREHSPTTPSSPCTPRDASSSPPPRVDLAGHSLPVNLNQGDLLSGCSQ